MIAHATFTLGPLQLSFSLASFTLSTLLNSLTAQLNSPTVTPELASHLSRYIAPRRHPTTRAPHSHWSWIICSVDGVASTGASSGRVPPRQSRRSRLGQPCVRARRHERLPAAGTAEVHEEKEQSENKSTRTRADDKPDRRTRRRTTLAFTKLQGAGAEHQAARGDVGAALNTEDGKDRHVKRRAEALCRRDDGLRALCTAVAAAASAVLTVAVTLRRDVASARESLALRVRREVTVSTESSIWEAATPTSRAARRVLNAASSNVARVASRRAANRT